jgi:hypothetical protein
MGLAALVGGIVGAGLVGVLAGWVGFKLSFGAGYDFEFPGPGGGMLLLPFLLMGAVAGFWGGVCLVLYARYKLVQHRKLSLPMNGQSGNVGFV